MKKKRARNVERQYGYGRFAAERIVRMIRAIDDRLYPNATKWAREFEVSVRTIKRDIWSLRVMMSLPLAFDVRRNGFYFTKPVPHLPTIPLTEKEIVGLFVWQKSMAQYQGTAIQPVLESAFRKMVSQLDDSVKFSLGNLDEVLSIRPNAPGEMELEKFELLKAGVIEKRAVKFTYMKRGALKPSKKHVHPYRIGYVRNQWTLFAFDPAVKEMRKFVLFRLTKPVLTDDRFTVTAKFDLDRELSGSLGLFKGAEKHKIVIEFDRWGADDVRGHRWHSSQELTELPGRRLRVKLRLNSLEEVEGWVLSFGIHATVVGPQKLKERLFAATRELFQRYGGPHLLAGPDEG